MEFFVKRYDSFLRNKVGFVSDFEKEPEQSIIPNDELIDIFLSIRLIIKFIIFSLDNNIQYHEILYSILSKSEKQLIAICFKYNIKSSKHLVLASSFNYVLDTVESKYISPESITLPKISFKTSNTSNPYILFSEKIPY